MQDEQIEIREVVSRKDLKAFIAVPWAIYKNDPAWVPPLKVERKATFSAGHPYFKHARWKAWIAYQAGQPVGRISAQIDDLYLQKHHAHTGFFGLIESIEDPAVSAALFNVAEEWLKNEGMQRMLGPFSLSVNQEIGCLVDGFETPPYIMMGHALPYYGPMIESNGFTKAKDVLAYNVEPKNFALTPRIQRLLQRQLTNMTLRTVNRKNTEVELDLLRDIFNDAWSNNWGWVPFTKEEFRSVGKELFMIVPPELAVVAEVDGKPAAFLVMLPNVNEALADLNGRLFPFGWAKLLWRLKFRFPKTGRVALMGVRKEYQHTRLGPALAFLMINGVHEPAMKYGVEHVEMSWILEDNQAMRSIIEKIGGYVTKRYRMFGKQFTGGRLSAA